MNIYYFKIRYKKYFLNIHNSTNSRAWSFNQNWITNSKSSLIFHNWNIVFKFYIRNHSIQIKLIIQYIAASLCYWFGLMTRGEKHELLSKDFKLMWFAFQMSFFCFMKGGCFRKIWKVIVLKIKTIINCKLQILIILIQFLK